MVKLLHGWDWLIAKAVYLILTLKKEHDQFTAYFPIIHSVDVSRRHQSSLDLLKRSLRHTSARRKKHTLQPCMFAELDASLFFLLKKLRNQVSYPGVV
ncbi:hypothetical protein ECG_06129 [Echinococcus granulosus]|nr:hypothetical protein ECG_06129 [Echinococcus granulosus]